MSTLSAYYDSLVEADWFSNLHPIFNSKSTIYECIKPRGQNPSFIEEITSYDKPDIILTRDNTPILVIEKTQEVPTGHNVGQRFARLVRAVEMNVPAMYYFPYDANKHGEYSGLCNMNIRILEACMRIYDIHNTPLLCVKWITENGEIVCDGREDYNIMDLLKSFVSSDFNKNCDGFKKQIDSMDYEYRERLKTRQQYRSLPPSVTEEITKDFLRNNSIKNAGNIAKRPKTFVYTINMTEEKCKRQDPYTGTAFIYDYISCREGPNVAEKKNNLVFKFPMIKKEVWLKKNPNDPKTKSSNWYSTVNMMVFTDDYIIVRE